jgi:hypothetical protein
MPFAASVATEAVDLIDGPRKQPLWTKHKRGRWAMAMIVGDDVLLHKMLLEIGWCECNNQPLLTSIRFNWESRQWEEEGTRQSTGPKMDMEEKKEVKSEDTTTTLSTGCSKPSDSAVDHATINIKSKGSGW